MDKARVDLCIDVKLLKMVMVEKGIDNIKQMSSKCGVNRNTMSEILRNKTKPSSEMMYRIVRNLNLDEELAGKIFFKRNLRKM